MEIYRSLAEIRGQLSGPSAVALGYFDGIHLGHQRVIQSAVAFSSNMTPSVFTFNHLEKKGAVILSPEAKHRSMEQLGIRKIVSLDFAEVRTLSPLQFIHDVLIGAMGARVVCCGNNFHFGKDASGSLELLIEECDKQGVSVLTAGQVSYADRPVSSSEIRVSLAKGDMERVTEMMGRPYSIDFEVVHGQQLGRTLDFPTINQVYPAGYCVPAYGVYATVAVLDGVYYPAVTNVGIKPTVGADRPLAETYIIGGKGNLYGKHIPVYFVQHLRSEVKFPSLEALRSQISVDTKSAENISKQHLNDRYF